MENSKAPHIAFVASAPGYDLFNRKSAIDSILCSVLLLLKNDFNITVNGENLEDLNQKANQTNPHDSSISLSKKNKIAQFVPFSIKERIKFRKQKKFNQLVIEKYKLNKPDIIIELLLRGSDLGQQLAVQHSVPYLVYYDSPLSHQFEEIFGRKCPGYYVKNEIKSLRKANSIITYSPSLANHILKVANLNSTNHIEIFQTLDYSRLSPITRQKVESSVHIGFIGTFMNWHRVDLLIDAFHHLRKDCLDVKLFLIGAGQNFEKSKMLVKEKHLENDVVFTGFVDGEKLEYYKSLIDIGVMSGSNWYGIPTKVFEYGAANIASIAPLTPTISDLFAKTNEVLLFENNNGDDLYLKLKQLVTNPSLRSKLATDFHLRIVSEYNPDAAKKFYVNLINKLLDLK